MSLKQKLLYELESHRESSISGQMIAKKFGVSRSAVWKAINSLKDDGYKILSSTNRGYRLSDESDLISKEGIKSCLKDKFSEFPIYCFESVDSTNQEAKRRLAGGFRENFLVVAQQQTEGKGRNGHVFYSPNTGAYMTLVVHPETSITNNICLTSAAAVAVVKTIEEFTDSKPQIKWVNDIYIGQKKVSGILTEAVTDFEERIVTSVLIGIGLNIRTKEFPNEIKDIADAINPKNDATKNQFIASLTQKLLEYYENLSEKSFLEDYRTHSMVIGKKISYVKNGKKETALAVDIEASGNLKVVKENGETDFLRCGEISVKL